MSCPHYSDRLKNLRCPFTFNPWDPFEDTQVLSGPFLPKGIAFFLAQVMV